MRYYFIDKEIYFKNEKLPDRKVELFDITFANNKARGYDKDRNYYCLDKEEVFTEE